MTKQSPYASYFSDVFIAYLYMCRVSRTEIKDKPKYTTIKRWLDTMNTPHIKINGIYHCKTLVRY